MMPQRVGWLKQHYESGLFIASGRQKPRKGGVILTRTLSRAKLTAILSADPFVKSGCASFDVVEFKPSMTAPGAESLREIRRCLWSDKGPDLCDSSGMQSFARLVEPVHRE